MFGRRQGASAASAPALIQAPAPTAAQAPARSAAPVLVQESAPAGRAEPMAIAQENQRSEDYSRTKSMIFGALTEAIALAQLARLDGDTAREEIRDIVSEII